MKPFDFDKILIRDAHALGRTGKGNRRLPARQRARLEASKAAYARRDASVPEIDFPRELPIAKHIDEIVALLSTHQVVIVAGETGSGKTTQLPKACLAAGLGRRGMIGHTQPRRLPARAVAERIASELGTPFGGVVGFAVRFSERYGDDTLVKVMTDGLLLAEIRTDRNLLNYEVLIIDEAHERSLNVDFLIGYARTLLRRRPDLRLIITSATIDVEAFRAHFDGAPVVAVGGRGFPVDVVYREQEDGFEQGLQGCLEEIARSGGSGPRDVLVFLSGEREIFDTSRWLKREYGDRYDILPLYARLPSREQRRVFVSGPRRRVVLATNVAETSLTVPNIGYVIDAGNARISRYSYRSKIQRLPIEPISQASAEQRKGRCGRIAPGTCYRLFSAEDFEGRPQYTDPELKRTNLASVVLQMRAFRLGRTETFPFIDPPDPRVVKDAERTLVELGALEDDRLTRVGRTMARLPVDPRLARMLVAAHRQGCVAEMLIIVSALSIQDPRESPPDRREAADRKHREYAHPKSDFLTFVNLWNALETARRDMTRSAFRRMLERSFLSPSRVGEWRALHRQLLLAAKRQRMRVSAGEADYASVHRALLAGSLSFIGMRDDDKGTYRGARSLTFRIFPGSAMARSQPRWIVAGEIAETQRTYARCVAAVEPAWIEKAAGNVLNRAWSEPHWDDARGEAVAFERVTVYGLPVVERRTVGYARIDPEASREIFVRDGLLRSDSAVSAPFLDHNRAMAREIAGLQAKSRRADLLATDRALAAFYLERLPGDVLSTRTLAAWLGRADANTAARLEMTESDLLARTDFGVSDADFPPSLAVDGLALDLKYRFAPGDIDDGVSLQVGLGALPHLGRDELDWLVPGFFEQKCEALLRALPKSARRRLLPLGDKARGISAHLLRPERYRRGALRVALAQSIEAEFGLRFAPADFRDDRISPFLRMNVQVLDGAGRTVDQDRDVGALKDRLLPRVERRAAAEVTTRFESRGLRGFPSAGVPASRVVEDGDTQAVVYPALRDDGDRVDLIMLSHRSSQAATNRRGYSRLALLADPRTSRYLRRQVNAEKTMALHYAILGTKDMLADELLLASAWACFFVRPGQENQSLPRTASAFDSVIDAHRSRLTAVFASVLEGGRDVLERRFAAANRIGALDSPAFAPSREDMTAHLERLVPPDFPNRIPLEGLADLSRYLLALEHRADNLPGRVLKDRENLAAATRWESRVASVADALPGNPGVVQLENLVEEYRVALFSQRIGTKLRVSPERLARALEPLEAEARLR
ncbi:MAG: ATP-dependent RNA helicase HrpA [Gammaproteobacteria bacterium]|nr:ATP-dependent RNA helicase HrpA [Gammaproteobacteria bacterium]